MNSRFGSGRPGLVALALGTALWCVLPANATPTALTVTGSVIDERGGPRPGARVELSAIPTRYDAGRRRLEGREVHPAATATTADGDGRFSLEAPGPGLWRVLVSGPGLVPLEYFPLPLTASAWLPPAVTPAAAVLPLEVRDAAGLPLPGVAAFAVPDGEPGRQESGWRVASQAAFTDATGRATLLAPPRQALRLALFRPRSASEVAHRFTGGAIALATDAACARGIRVTTPSGAPLTGVLARSVPTMWPVGLTGSDGSLRFEAGCGRPASLLLQDPEGRRQLERLEPLEHGAVAEVIFGAERTTVRGRVLAGESQEPLGGALVWFQSDLGRFARADDKGRFELAAPAADRFWIQAEAPRHTPRRRWLSPAELAGAEAAVRLEPAAVLQGRVTTREGAAIEGAHVAAHPRPFAGGRPFYRPDAADSRADTDERGGFVLSGLVGDQPYEVVVGKPGYRSTAERIGVAARLPTGPVDTIRLVLIPDRGLAGRVVDPEGRPVAGAEVRIRPASASSRPAPAPFPGELAASTDRGGAFSFLAAPGETIDLTASGTGFAPTRWRSVAIADGLEPLDLGDIVLAPGATLRGVVTGAQQEAVPGATVSCLGSRGPDEANCGAAATDAGGRFELGNLQAGAPLALAVEAEGFLPARIRGVRAPTETPLRVALERAATLRGRVRDEAQRPVPGAEIRATWPRFLAGHGDRFEVGARSSRGALSDEAGIFELVDCPSGKARLEASAPGFVPAGPVEVVVGEGGAGDEVSLTLERGGAIAGTVVTAAGEPVARARVRVEPAIATTDATGRYQIEGVPFGSAEAEVSHPDFDRQTAAVEVGPGSNTHDWILERGSEVLVWVHDEEGGAIAGAEVSLTRSDGSERRRYHAVTDSEGRSRFPSVSAGAYGLEALRGGYSPSPVKTLVVDSAGQPLKTDLVLGRGALLSGRVTGLSAVELAAVEVAAEEAGGRVVGGRVGPSGDYEVRHLPAGDWLVSASLHGGQRSARARVSTAPADRRVVRDLRFEPRLELSGRVLYLGAPVTDAMIFLDGLELAVSRSAATGYDGRFRLQDLEAGRYELTVSQPANGILQTDLIELHSDRDLSIDLRPSAVRGAVRDAGSLAPVSGASVVLSALSDDDGRRGFSVGAGTAEDGLFVIPRVPPGRYLLRAERPGYSPAERDLTVPAGDDLAGIEIALEPSRGLAARVATKGGRRLPYLDLRLLDGDGRLVVAESQPVSREGLARFESVPSGRWTAALAGPDTGVAMVSVTVPGAPIEVLLPEGRAVEVRVSDLVTSDVLASVAVTGLDGRPLAALEPGGALQSRWVMSGGRARIPGVPAGSWTVTITAPDGRSWQRALSTDGASEQRLEIP